MPEVTTTWNALYASIYCNMHFSVARAAMDAHDQNDIVLRDRARNHAVAGRQPHISPNYVPYSTGGCPHRAAAVDPPGEA